MRILLLSDEVYILQFYTRSSWRAQKLKHSKTEKINLDRIKRVITSTHSWPLVPMSARLYIYSVFFLNG